MYANFEPVETEEMYRFLAIVIAMGLDPRSSVKKYYSTKGYLNTPWYKQIMKQRRFEALYHTFLHAGGADAGQQEKIEPFLEALMKSFQSDYYPSKAISLDEMVVGFRGRWKYRQFNASKSSKYHIKHLDCATASTAM